jgi:hypothetical protein
MNDINKHCEDNLGGLNSFKFIPTTEVNSIVDAINGKVCEPLVVANLGRWYDCYATEGTIKFSEELQDSKHGDFFQLKLTAFVPKGRTDVSDQLEKMKNKNFIIDCLDNNERRVLVGTKEKPMRFKYSYDTGSGVPNRNGYTLEFYGVSIKNTPTYFV